VDRKLLEKTSYLLSEDERVIFAYLFGSSIKSREPNDIDIAIYCIPSVMNNPFEFTSDMKIELSRLTNISPDDFDITLINHLLIDERIDSLTILGDIFDGVLLIDKDTDLRTDIIEKVSAQFRESAGLMTEVYS
jgi:hypothetical protein